MLTKAEARFLLEHLKDPTYRLQANLLLGTSMRFLECLRLHVKDPDFGPNPIVVTDTKGNEDQVTLLPSQLEFILQEHRRHVNALHQSINPTCTPGMASSIFPMPWHINIPELGRVYVFPVTKWYRWC